MASSHQSDSRYVDGTMFVSLHSKIPPEWKKQFVNIQEGRIAIFESQTEMSDDDGLTLGLANATIVLEDQLITIQTPLVKWMLKTQSSDESEKWMRVLSNNQNETKKRKRKADDPDPASLEGKRFKGLDEIAASKLEQFVPFKEARQSQLTMGCFGDMKLIARVIKINDEPRFTREKDINNIMSNCLNVKLISVDLITSQNLYLIFEEEKTDLSNVPYLKKIGSNDIKLFAKQFTRGLHHLKKLNIIHGDIQPKHLLVRERGNYKCLLISNFKRAHHISEFPSRLGLPTPERVWCAPESWGDDPRFSFSSDMWSSGLTLYYMVTKGGMVPTDREEVPSRSKIVKNSMPHEYFQLVYLSLDKSPEARLTSSRMSNWPTFWEPHTLLKFYDSLFKLVHRLKHKHDDTLTAILYDTIDWRKKVDRAYLEELDDYQTKNKKTDYKNHRMGFISFNRNLMAHLQQTNQKLKQKHRGNLIKTDLELLSTPKMSKLTNQIFETFEKYFDRDFNQEMWDPSDSSGTEFHQPKNLRVFPQCRR